FLGFLPDPMRRAAEGWLGVPEPAPGGGARRRPEYAPHFWDAPRDPWLGPRARPAAPRPAPGVSTPALRGARRGLRSVLVGLRLGVVLLLLAVLLPQLRLWFERQGWPDVVLLLDDSQSMSAVDRYSDPAVRDAAARLSQQAGIAEA